MVALRRGTVPVGPRARLPPDRQLDGRDAPGARPQARGPGRRPADLQSSRSTGAGPLREARSPRLYEPSRVRIEGRVQELLLHRLEPVAKLLADASRIDEEREAFGRAGGQCGSHSGALTRLEANAGCDL